MRLPLLIFTLSILLFSSGFAQEIKNERPPYREKHNQHSFTFSPVAYFGYKYVYGFHPEMGIGFGLSVGARYPAIEFYPGWNDEILEIAKFNILYRAYILKNSYLNIGPFISTDIEEGPYYGLEGEIFYGWRNVKFGQGVQLGIQQYDSQWRDDKKELRAILTLFIFQVNF